MLSSIVILQQLNVKKNTIICEKSLIINNYNFEFCQKLDVLSKIQVSKILYTTQKTKIVQIFINTNTIKESGIDLQVENVDVNSFALFGFNMQMQVVTESIINVTIKFEVLSGALICITCDVHVTSSSLIFSGVGLKMSGVVLESLNNIILEFSFVQFRLSSANTSGIVNTVKQHLAGFSITDCKLSGSSLVVSSNNGYLCSNALVPVTLSIQVLLVCVDQMERTGAHSQAIASVELEQISCGICGSMLVVYGLCTDGLEHAMEVNGMYKCVLPFEFVDDKCVCAYGYLLNLTSCVNVLTALQNGISSSILDQFKLDISNLQNDIQSLDQYICNNFSISNENLIHNYSQLEQYIISNYTKLDNNILFNTTILDYRIFNNISALNSRISDIQLDMLQYESIINQLTQQLNCMKNLNHQIINGQCIETECQVDQEMINGTCQCKNIFSYILGNLCVCPANSVLVGDTCTCNVISGQVMLSGSCVCSTSGAFVSGSACTCGVNGLNVSNTCSCPAKSVLVGGTCTCNVISGQVMLSGSCVCSTSGAFVSGSACTCGVNGLNVSNTCSCPAKSVLVGDTCTCNVISGQVMLSGSCVCSTSGAFVSGSACTCGVNGLNVSNTCSCPANSVLVGGTCTCNVISGQVMLSGSCVCSTSGAFVSGSTCTCGVNGLNVSNTCSCPAKSVLVGDTCTCNVISGQVMLSGSCVCSTSGAFVSGSACTCGVNGLNVSNTCSCPAKSVLVGDTCTCNVISGQVMLSGSCVCSTSGAFVSGSACTCGVNSLNVSNTCSCPAKSVLVGDTCTCNVISGQVMLSNSCVCSILGAIIFNSACVCRENEQVRNGSCQHVIGSDEMQCGQSVYIFVFDIIGVTNTLIGSSFSSGWAFNTAVVISNAFIDVVDGAYGLSAVPLFQSQSVFTNIKVQIGTQNIFGGTIMSRSTTVNINSLSIISKTGTQITQLAGYQLNILQAKSNSANITDLLLNLSFASSYGNITLINNITNEMNIINYQILGNYITNQRIALISIITCSSTMKITNLNFAPNQFNCGNFSSFILSNVSSNSKIQISQVSFVLGTSGNILIQNEVTSNSTVSYRFGGIATYITSSTIIINDILYDCYNTYQTNYTEFSGFLFGQSLVASSKIQIKQLCFSQLVASSQILSEFGIIGAVIGNISIEQSIISIIIQAVVVDKFGIIGYQQTECRNAFYSNLKIVISYQPTQQGSGYYSGISSFLIGHDCSVNNQVQNIEINNSNSISYRYQGGVIGNCQMTILVMQNITIENCNITGNFSIGGFIGAALNSCTITIQTSSIQQVRIVGITTFGLVIGQAYNLNTYNISIQSNENYINEIQQICQSLTNAQSVSGC
ncbi:Conserved_hypothetical protein [Hexamita inflata]|uniref:Uncharacterized protein n=1 Tax=Hexamita inflata TaxID=28002 RepID=A0AA86TDA8_9EUKA|nr:Conserved hypothetical protein [Hexamita inflata]